MQRISPRHSFGLSECPRHAFVGIGKLAVLAAFSNWLLALHTGIVGVLALATGASLSATGLLCAHRILPSSVRREHNDVSGFILAIVGVIYAVLLAFIAVAVWQSYGEAENLVQTEANVAGDLYRDTVAFPEATAAALRNSLFVYAEVVIQDEWPALAAGSLDDVAGWQLLDRFHTELLQLHTTDSGLILTQANMVRMLDRLYDARRGRFHAANARLPAILWWNLIAGAIILMIFTYLFGVPNLAMHVAMVSLLGGMIGLVLALIVLLSNPFRGQSHVSVEPFNTLTQAVEHMAYPHR
jgi:Protein of unknown function (DUF4239)